MTARKFPRLAFVDLETTGAGATDDRITEVGIVEVDEDGVREWSSLVNPHMPIPPFIQSLTGISDEMVRDAPDFGQLADEISARLADRVFIAHNARFDYGFLRSEFRRTGKDFLVPVLCTVRLSRKLFPGFEKHNLDSLIERHGLHVAARHRALGDAQLIWQFWNKIHETHAAEVIEEAVSKLVSKPESPSRIDTFQFEALPSTHGVYEFYGENDTPLYVGKADNLRREVLSHFGSGRGSSRAAQLRQEVTRVDWCPVSGEIGALLQEAALAKKLAPAYNQKPRCSDAICAWRLIRRKGIVQASIASADDLFFGHDPDLYGLYADPGKASDALKAIADGYGLCHAMLGLEKVRSGKPCCGYRNGKCTGACLGKESIDAHNERAVAALQRLRLQPWPYPGAIAIREAKTLHVIDGWAYLGSVQSEAEATALLQNGRPRFDREVYQILHKRLPMLVDQVIPL